MAQVLRDSGSPRLTNKAARDTCTVLQLQTLTSAYDVHVCHRFAVVTWVKQLRRGSTEAICIG
jgi:hypothetical protein